MTLPTTTVDEVTQAKDYWAHNHCQTSRLPTRDEQPHRWALAEYIAALNPSSVLEFGTASARNLGVLRGYLPTADLAGIDINKTTLAAARREYGDDIELHEGDESLLAQFVDNAFDVVFVSSVLDHVPHPQWQQVYNELVRVARHALVVHEPVYPYSTTVPASDPVSGTVRYSIQAHGKPPIAPEFSAEVDFANLSSIAAVPYSYAHDYFGHDMFLRVEQPLPIKQTPMYEAFGNLYLLMVREK
jgi:SAM-dependent methyltransferase